MTRAALYIDGHRTELLNLAGADTTGEAALDESDPGWRDRAARVRRWSVVRHEDGTTSVIDAPSLGRRVRVEGPRQPGVVWALVRGNAEGWASAELLATLWWPGARRRVRGLRVRIGAPRRPMRPR